MNKYFPLLILMLISTIARAQTDSTQNDSSQQPVKKESKPGIKLMGRATQNSILLRWAPNKPTVWQYANKYGYTIERTTLVRDKRLIEEMARKTIVLSKDKKPIPLDDWEPLVKNNKMAAVAAQALYGSSFELTSAQKSTGIVSFIQQSKELETRYSFALFTADISRDIASASALFYEDKNIIANEKYLYKVYANVPSNIAKIDTGYVFIGPSDYAPLPKIKKLKAEYANRMVMISFDKIYYERYYSSYLLERSDDGGTTYQVYDDTPRINASKIKNETQIFLSDSLPSNDQEYYFRVRGLTPFGDKSPPSDPVSGQGFVPLSGNPDITFAGAPDNQNTVIQWSFPEEHKKQLAGFYIERAPKHDGPFTALNLKPLPAETRTYTDSSPKMSSSYYRVKAIGPKGQFANSYAYLVTLIDSIPPAPPVEVSGKIDSSGIVRLTWKANTERDILGYRVYRSNFKTTEFVQVTNVHTLDNNYVDTINVKTLTKKIFYAVVAIDGHYNPSEYSQILELKRPDIIPPVSPVFLSYKQTDQGVELEWSQSSSEDVVKHLLYRNQTGTEKWTLLGSFDNDEEPKFVDKETHAGNRYQYILIAVDDSRLESNPSPPLSIIGREAQTKKAVEKIYVKKTEDGIHIAWKYEEKNIDAFWIYRAKKNNSLQRLTIVDGKNREYIDKISTTLELDQSYTYAIQVLFKSGITSPISKMYTVSF